MFDKSLKRKALILWAICTVVIFSAYMALGTLAFDVTGAEASSTGKGAGIFLAGVLSLFGGAVMTLVIGIFSKVLPIFFGRGGLFSSNS